MLARRANAEARIKIQETLDGLSMDADIKALDGVRESIHKMSAEADVGREIGEQSLDKKLEKIKQKTVSANARAQLEALKQAQAAASSQAVEAQAKKTL
jgi:phage shock protein A